MTLPSDFNEAKVKVINIDYRVELGDVSSLSGLHGGPVPTVLGDVSLIEHFLQAGVNLVRMPQGYLCEYTLSGIFPNPTANPDDPASYNFDAIDSVMVGAAALQGRILFQALFDVGLNTCDADAQLDGGGQRPANPALWAKVIVNTLRHFNKDLDSGGWPDTNRQTFNVFYVESIDDPLGRGGYTDVKDVVDDFIVLSDAVKTAFPDAFDGSRMNMVGPAMSISSASEVSGHAIFTFVDELINRGKIDHLNVLSFQTEVQQPAENEAIASALRQGLKDRGLDGKVELWATRYREDPSEDFNPEPKNDLEVPKWSNFSGAFQTATRIAWQDDVDAAIFYRGDRRHRSIDGSNVSIVEPSPMWTAKGQWNSAGFAWLPWRLIAADCPDDPDNPGQKLACRSRVQVGAPPAADAPGLRVLSVKEDLRCADNLLEQCPKIYVLIANTNVGQTQVDYQVKISGVGSADDGTRQVKVNRAVINQSTSDFTYESSTLVTLIGDALFYQFSSSVPAVDFLVIELNP